MKDNNYNELLKEIYNKRVKEVTNYLILEEVANKENMNEVSDADLEFEFARLAEQYKMTIDQIKKALGNQLDSFRNNIKMSRVEKFLFDKNN